MNDSLFYALPLWGVFAATVLLGWLAVEGGFGIGAFGARKWAQEREAPMDAMVGSTLGLLAFVLAFTFGMAITRYDARKQLVLDDVIAIRTVDLRAQLLPEPHRGQIRAALREYVDVRLKAVLEPGELPRALKRSEELHDQLFSHAAALGQEVPAFAAPYTQALIQMIDLHSKRVTAAVSNRIPGVIWVALYCLFALAMGLTGYRGGVAGRRSLVATLIVIVAFSAMIALIADLDRSQEGFFKVSQQAMVDLQKKLNGTAGE
jgi:hypothetical protein